MDTWYIVVYVFDAGILLYSSYLDMSQQERQPLVTENGKVSVSFHFSIYIQSHHQPLLCDRMSYPFIPVLAV